MAKSELTKPTLVLLYGFPGAGKTFFARNICEDMQLAHLEGDRLRYELFEEPTNDKRENEIISHVMNYMTEEFLTAGLSVVYDMNALRRAQRRQLRELAQRFKAKTLLVWVQVDTESAFARAGKRDRRKADDKYSAEFDRTGFEDFIGAMQNPEPGEDYLVISGKHHFKTQRNTLAKRFYEMGVMSSEATGLRLSRPGLVNLVPNVRDGRVDPTRRNISINS